MILAVLRVDMDGCPSFLETFLLECLGRMQSQET